MMSIEEIHQNILGMDYVIATPRQKPMPSFYKLADGTILSVLIKVNHLIPNIINPNDMSANFTSEIQCFIPQSNRGMSGMQVGDLTNVTIIDEDMKYTTLKEDFNVYDMSNGTVVSVKTVLVQVKKTDQYNKEGEPIYNVITQPIVKITGKP